MGPRLGPLVVTSILARVRSGSEGGRAIDGGKLATTKPKGGIAKRIGDSKKLVAFDDSALGEAWARAIAARSGHVCNTPDELVASLAVDARDILQAPCPSHHVDLCWGTAGERFVSDDAMVAACKKDIDHLAARGLDVMRARVAILCTRTLNAAVDRGLSRFDVDLHAMERLTLAARDDVAGEVYALCGKVGGFDFYPARFGPLGGFLHTTLCEGRARSDYHVPGVGRLAFLRDADESHLIVGLASLVGKWMRDHLMRRVIHYHRAHIPDLPDASGYHDPVTTKFILASELVRKKQRVEASCFERTSLGKREEGSTSSGPRSKAPRSGRSTPTSTETHSTPRPAPSASGDAPPSRQPRLW